MVYFYCTKLKSNLLPAGICQCHRVGCALTTRGRTFHSTISFTFCSAKPYVKSRPKSMDRSHVRPSYSLDDLNQFDGRLKQSLYTTNLVGEVRCIF